MDSSQRAEGHCRFFNTDPVMSLIPVVPGTCNMRRQSCRQQIQTVDGPSQSLGFNNLHAIAPVSGVAYRSW